MKHFKKYWHIIIALILLILFLITGYTLFKYTYRTLLVYGFIKAGISLYCKQKKQPLLAGGMVFSLLLMLCAMLMIALTIMELMNISMNITPEWLWVAIRAIIDPIYYVLLPMISRKKKVA